MQKIMDDRFLSVVIGLIIFSFFLYNYVVFKFSEKIFKKNSKFFGRSLLCLGNLLIGICAVAYGLNNPFVFYIIIFLVLFIEFTILYKDKITRIFLIGNVFAVHIMAVHTIVYSSICLLFEFFLSGKIYVKEYIMPMSVLISLLILLIATEIVMRHMKAEQVRRVLNRNEQIFFLSIWLCACAGYLLINARIWFYETSIVNAACINQILSGFVLLVGVYLLIFYSFINCDLLNVQEENQELKAKSLVLQEKAKRDSLTGLYNKMTTEYLISEKLNSGGGVLFIIDVDNFKSINDFMGHAKGDEVIRQLAGELKASFRPGDIVGRIGGDEFMAFISNPLNDNLIYQKADEILRRFFKNFTDNCNKQHFISASVGITFAKKPGIKFEEIYKQADSALYYAKNKGKNTFHIHQKNEAINFKSYISLKENEGNKR